MFCLEHLLPISFLFKNTSDLYLIQRNSTLNKKNYILVEMFAVNSRIFRKLGNSDWTIREEMSLAFELLTH